MVISNKRSEKKYNVHLFMMIFSIFLKVLMPFIAIFVGFFIWLEGFRITLYFKDWYRSIYVFEFFYLGFWLITLCFLFNKFFSIDFQSKLLVFLFILAISIEFWVLLYYNHFSGVCFFMFYDYTPLDKFIIAFATMLPILEAIIMGISLFNSSIQLKLTHLTNIAQIKDVETPNCNKLYEIWTSFPIFFGIYHVFIILHELIIQKWCYSLSTNIIVLIALPWVILMGFYTLYSVSFYRKYKK